MGKIIAVFNRKGGTGKTSTAVSLGHGLALAGKRVLLLDCDPQGNVSISLGISANRTLYHLLIDDEAFEDCVVTARDGLDIIPANETLVAADQALVAEIGREKVLAEKLDGASDNYDFVLLDCAPSLNIINLNALLYADELYVPISMDYLALVGVKKILDNIDRVKKRLNKDIDITLVIPTFFDIRNNISKEILDTLRQRFADRVADPIRINVRLKEAPSYKQTIFEYSPGSTGAQDYKKLTERVLSYEKKESPAR